MKMWLFLIQMSAWTCVASYVVAVTDDIEQLRWRAMFLVLVIGATWTADHFRDSADDQADDTPDDDIPTPIRVP